MRTGQKIGLALCMTDEEPQTHIFTLCRGMNWGRSGLVGLAQGIKTGKEWKQNSIPATLCREPIIIILIPGRVHLLTLIHFQSTRQAIDVFPHVSSTEVGALLVPPCFPPIDSPRTTNKSTVQYVQSPYFGFSRVIKGETMNSGGIL